MFKNISRLYLGLSLMCFDRNFRTAEFVFKNRLSIVVVALLPLKWWFIFGHKFLSLMCFDRNFRTAEFVFKNRLPIANSSVWCVLTGISAPRNLCSRNSSIWCVLTEISALRNACFVGKLEWKVYIRGEALFPDFFGNSNPQN